MKRVLCFLLVLVVLSTSLVAVTGYSLIKESDNVTFTVIDEWGDRRYIEGVTAEMQFTHNYRLNWNVEFSPLGEAKTEYWYNNLSTNMGESYAYYGICNTSYGLLDMKNDNEKLKADFENLKNELKNPGDIRRFSLKLKDYYDYYPVNFDFTLGEMSVSWNTSIGFDDVGSYSYSGITPSRGKGLLEALNRYLKIPVHEEDVREIKIHRGDYAFSYSCSYSGSFDFEFYNVVFSDKLYFTFNNEITKSEEAKRTLVDTTQIPGGYGIYSIPYEENDIKYEEIKTVYSIPSDATVEALFCDEERNELYLTLHENDKYVLHIIDAEAMTDKTVIELFDFHFEEYVRVVQNEDFFVFIKNDVDFIVVERTAEGKYESALTGTMPPETVAERNYFSYYSWFGFDGERLVVLVVENTGYEEQSNMTILPDIMVLTEDGLTYYCKWICSLSTPVSNWGSQFVYRSGACKVMVE